jgi:hypothetical protein
MAESGTIASHRKQGATDEEFLRDSVSLETEHAIKSDQLVVQAHMTCALRREPTIIALKSTVIFEKVKAPYGALCKAGSGSRIP